MLTSASLVRGKENDCVVLRGSWPDARQTLLSGGGGGGRDLDMSPT